MRIVDCHVHVGNLGSASEMLKEMDANGVQRVLVLSQSERLSPRKTLENIKALAKYAEADRARLGCMAWVNPTLPNAAGIAETALTELGFCGIKIIPDHFFCYEPRLEPFWERMNELKASILFHTGILYGFEDGSRFCHPEYLEKLQNYPNIRFAMAHVSWPWCEECLAVMGRMKAAVGYRKDGWQSYIDLTPGTPKHIRKQAISNAVSFCGGVDHIMWGTDSSTGKGLSYQKEVLDGDLAIFKEIGLDAAQQERILSGTADEVFPAKK
ncbi:MAG: amidohydrolase family protein [Phycisphaerae bacterium]